jgi:hypothetical protein
VPACTRLIVAIDGTYVRSNLDTDLYQHYAVAGRIERDGILAGRFAWIAQRPGEAEQFMKAALQANGWTTQTQVVVLADGADGLKKNLVRAAVNSEPRSILDWFHISMRLRPIEQMATKQRRHSNMANGTWLPLCDRGCRTFATRCGTASGAQRSRA